MRWFFSGLMVPVLCGVLAYSFANNPAPDRQQPTADVDPLQGTMEFAATADELQQSTDIELDEQPVEEEDQATELAPVDEPVRIVDSWTSGETEGDPLPPNTVEYVVRVVKPDDTLDRVFRQINLNVDDLASIRDLPGVRENLDQLKPGDLVTLAHADGLVQAMSRRLSETRILSVRRVGNGFNAKFIETPVEIRTVNMHGVVRSSLLEAALRVGIAKDTVARMTNDIFGWDIDFALDVRPGDRFTIVYEKKYRDGQYVGDGRILAAEFINNGRVHRAVYYETPDGKLTDYFAQDGRSMRRQFLRAPLDFIRISSNFASERLHPILNSIRAHRGVDYAAPIGTAIRAAGDGVVSFAGVKGEYGNLVVLQHGAGVSTLYGHMLKIVRGLRNGSQVKQGELIGYVGRSGAATGPHLHYEYRVKGVHQNPRTVRLPAAAPIAPTYMLDFRSHAGAMFSELDRARDTTVVAALPSG